MIRPTKLTNSDYFYRGYCHFQLSHKKEAQSDLSMVVDWFGEPPPERHWSVAWHMLDDMKGWSENGLDTISRKMYNVGVRLKDSKGGPETQRIQGEIVDWLDKKIAELEEQQKKNNQAASKNEKSETKPLDDSVLPAGVIVDGKIDVKKLKTITPEAWGKLPDKERVRILQDMRRQLPPSVVEAIESYFKKIEKGK